jgi:hypothetical protein
MQFPKRRNSMRLFRNSGVILAALVFAAVLAPASAWATTTKDCPTEPKQNVPITSGETYSGTNCELYTTGDVDSFVFKAAAGDTWDMVLGVASGATTNICLTLYAPNNSVASPQACTNIEFGGDSVGTVLQLTTAGTYTMVVQETSDATVGYSLSLERISPAPADATALSLSKNITGAITVATAQEAYTFYGVTTGKYQIAASLVSGDTQNVCFNVYQPNGSSALSSGAPCTNIEFGGDTISVDLTPTQNGTYVVLVYAGGNDTTVGYNLEVSCLLGKCIKTTPKCELTDALSYSSGTLTMDFTIGTPSAVTWNAWLVSDNKTELLFSTSQPVTEPAVTVTKTASLEASGTVGVVSTLTTATDGITCSSWETVNTGKAASYRH